MSGGDFARLAETVDELAFQTKLLALNAALEAARAQDPGRSLARLAIEMSRLVDRSTRAVGDIRASVGKRRAKPRSRPPASSREEPVRGGGRSKPAVSTPPVSSDDYSGPERRRGGRPWSRASGRKPKRRPSGKHRPPGGEDSGERDD